MKKMTIADIMAGFLDSIRAYERESGSAITFDERGSSEFVNIFFGDGDFKIEENKPKPLFITDDGVEVFDRDGIVWNVRNNNFDKIKIHSIHLNDYDFEHKVFFHESNADEYIWRNRPLFSYNEIWKYAPYGSPLSIFEKLAIERSEE